MLVSLNRLIGPAVTTVRLSYYAQRLPAISVASAKSNALTGFALLWLGGLAAQKQLAGGSVIDFWQGWHQPQGWILVLWAALGPGALAAFLQTQVSTSCVRRCTWRVAVAGNSSLLTFDSDGKPAC